MSEKPTYEELEQRVRELEKAESERKQVDEALRESEAFSETLIDAIPTPVFYKDRHGKYLGFNSAFETFFGATKEGLIGKSVFDTYSPELAEIYHRHDEELLNSGGVQIYESQWKASNGKLHDIIFNKAIFYDREGNTRGLIGTIIDITEIKQAEEALRESEELHKEAQRVAHIGHWELYPEIGTPVWSDEIFRIFGLKPQEGEPSFTDHETHLHPDDWPLLNKAVALANSEGTPFDIIFRIVRPDDEIRWMHAIGTTSKDEKGKVTKLFGTAQDITDLKRAEEALRESEEKYRTLFEDSKDAIYIATREGNIVSANQSFVDVFGYTKEEITEWKTEDTYVDADYRSRFTKMIEENGFVKDFEAKLRKKNEAEMDCLITATIQRSTNGNIVGYQGIIRDITELKRAHEEREKLISELKKALAEVKTLSGMLPICANCKKIRDDKDYWNRIEIYIGKHSEAEFSHGICPECTKELYPEFELSPGKS